MCYKIRTWLLNVVSFTSIILLFALALTFALRHLFGNSRGSWPFGLIMKVLAILALIAIPLETIRAERLSFLCIGLTLTLALVGLRFGFRLGPGRPSRSLFSSQRSGQRPAIVFFAGYPHRPVNSVFEELEGAIRVQRTLALAFIIRNVFR